MIEHVEQGRRVLVWPSAFSPDEVAALATRVSFLVPNQYLLTDQGALARAIGSEIRPRMIGAPPFKWSHQIVRSVQSRPLGWHYDLDYQTPWKVLVYLSSLGGTEFRSGLTVGGKLGDVVMFDVSLEHRAHPFVTGPSRPKTILGLRALHAEAA